MSDTRPKRPRRRKTRNHAIKPGLTVRWCPVEKDFSIDSPNRPDGHLANTVLFSERIGYDDKIAPSFLTELRKRGYDTTTLVLTVERLYPPNGTPVDGR